jgi:putative phage-type endonuclease
MSDGLERLDPGGATVVAHTHGMSRAEWLKLRRTGLGGSDVAAIAGLSKWATPLSVWLEKTGTYVPDDDNASEAMEWGTLLEEPVANEVARREGLELVELRAMLAHPDRPYMLANLDRTVVTDPHAVYAGPGVYEGKTTNAYRADDWTRGRVPYAAALQTHHYLAVTGWEFAYIGVLIGGQRLEVRRVDRDDELVELVLALEAEFWHRVETLDPPTAVAADDELLGVVWQAVEDETAELSDELLEVVEERGRAAAELATAKDRVKALDARVKFALGEASVGTGPDGRAVVSYREVAESARPATVVKAHRRISYPKRKAEQ